MNRHIEYDYNEGNYSLQRLITVNFEVFSTVHMGRLANTNSQVELTPQNNLVRKGCMQHMSIYIVIFTHVGFRIITFAQSTN